MKKPLTGHFILLIFFTSCIEVELDLQDIRA
jgi:hypothetical protein